MHTLWASPVFYLCQRSAVTWTDCVTGCWHISVFMFVSCAHECVCGVPGSSQLKRAMCGRGSNHVLRPSALLSILVGALACGRSARVTGKRQKQQAVSGPVPEKNSFSFSLAQWAVFCTQGSHSFFFSSPSKSSGGAPIDVLQMIFTKKMFSLARRGCLCEPFGFARAISIMQKRLVKGVAASFLQNWLFR